MQRSNDEMKAVYKDTCYHDYFTSSRSSVKNLRIQLLIDWENSQRFTCDIGTSVKYH